MGVRAGEKSAGLCATFEIVSVAAFACIGTKCNRVRVIVMHQQHKCRHCGADYRRTPLCVPSQPFLCVVCSGQLKSSATFPIHSIVVGPLPLCRLRNLRFFRAFPGNRRGGLKTLIRLAGANRIWHGNAREEYEGPCLDRKPASLRSASSPHAMLSKARNHAF